MFSWQTHESAADQMGMQFTQSAIPPLTPAPFPISQFPIAPTAGAEPASAIPCVLIVDDEPEAGALFRDLIREQLDPRAQVLEATDGRTALQLAEHHPVDIAIVDYRLPDFDGLEIIKRLQDTQSNPATLLITGEGSERIAAKAIRQGAHEYIVKTDLHEVNLGRLMREAITAHRGARQTVELTEQMQQNHDELDHLVRALSHDMNANFMLLKHSFRHLQQSTAAIATPEVHEDLSYLDACLDQSQRFLDDLITLGKTGSVDMQPESVELMDVVNEVKYEQQDLLAERGIQLEIAARLPQLWCNKDRLKQIVTNLVRNAARHGCDAAHPKIMIRGGQMFSDAAMPQNAAMFQESMPQHTSSPTTSMAWFRISDNGPGIPAKDREAIFEPGARLASAHAQGSGMGLAIVDKLTKRMGGSIRVLDATVDATLSDAATSQPGAVFEICLPAPVTSSTTGSASTIEDARVDAAERRRPRIATLRSSLRKVEGSSSTSSGKRPASGKGPQAWQITPPTRTSGRR